MIALMIAWKQLNPTDPVTVVSAVRCYASRGLPLVTDRTRGGPPMNRLVTVLQHEPALVTEAARRERVDFTWLLEALGDKMMNNGELAALHAAPQAEATLSNGYLQAITGGEWDAVLGSSEEYPQHVSDWWTVMVPGDSSLGLTLPEDASSDELVALLGGPPESAVPISWNPATLTLNVVSADHCLPVTRDGCAPGTCGGCRSRRVYNKRTGYGVECRCDD